MIEAGNLYASLNLGTADVTLTEADSFEQKMKVQGGRSGLTHPRRMCRLRVGCSLLAARQGTAGPTHGQEAPLLMRPGGLSLVSDQAATCTHTGAVV